MTQKTQHTSGPWQSKHSPSGDLIIQAIDDARLFPPMVATVSNWRCDAAEIKLEAEANARLIASAPELLEALQRLLAVEDERFWKPNNGLAEGGELTDLTAARAAIAKATGNQ